MPGSLLGLSSKIRRSESGRSDRSDISAYSIDSKNSGKKVSFNKAVRVKKYPRRGESIGEDGIGNEISPEKRFWFKVYKNRHPNQDIYESNKKEENGYKLDPIAETDGPRSLPNLKYTSDVGVGTSRFFPKHSSQKQADKIIPVRPNHVKKIVNKFNDEAAVTKLHRDDDSEDDVEVRHTYTHSLPPTGLNGHKQPPEPPVDYVDGTIEGKQVLRYKRNPLVNGVKVIFGMAQLKKRDDKLKSNVQNKNLVNIKKSQGTSTRDRPMNGHAGPPPYNKTNIILADQKRKDSTLRRSRNNGELNNNNIDNRLATLESNQRQNSTIRPIEEWTSGDQLISDSSRFESTTDKIADGQLYRSMGEESKIWRNEKRTVYEEEYPSMTLTFDRRAKSYGDLRLNDNGLERKAIGSGKVLSNDELYHSDKYNNNINNNTKAKETRIRSLNYYGQKKDQGIQCNRIGPDTDYELAKHRVIKSRDGYVSAYSDVPTLEKQLLKQKTSTASTMTASTIKSNVNSDAIYSQVDKSKKTKKFGASLTSTPRSDSPTSKLSKGQPSVITESVKSQNGSSDGNKSKVKSSQKSFGFRLKKAFGSDQKDTKANTYSAYEEDDDNWYDVDADVAAAEKRGKKNADPPEVRIEEEEFSSVSEANSEKRNAPPASVMREMDPKKREISYENVPHPGAGHTGREVSAGGMWFRNADEDYRRQMAENDVTYPSGSHVGNNEAGSSATLSRLNDKRTFREDIPIKSFTLDRRHKDNTPVKIMVNGHEIDDNEDFSRYSLRRRTHNRHRDENQLPSSVQSDPVHHRDHRGGLAAAYKARQKAALKRSNSTATSSVFGSHLSVNSPSRTRRHHHNSSNGSLVSSSDSDSTRRRRTLVMYIPGVSHPERRASDDEKMPSVSRTQSMHMHAKPNRYQKNPKTASQTRLYPGRSNTDLSEGASEEADTITPLRSDLKKKPRSPGNSLGRSSRKNLRRTHSMPKDTKFGWFKWRIKGKPSKEV